MEESLTVKNHSSDWSWIIWISRQYPGRMRCCSSISTGGAHDPGMGCPSITGWLMGDPELPGRVKDPPSKKIWTLYRIAQNERVTSAVCKQHFKLWCWQNIEYTRTEKRSLHELSYTAVLTCVVHGLEVKSTNHACRYCLMSLPLAHLIFD